MKILGRIIAFIVAAPIILLVGGFVVATIYSNWFTYTHRFRMTIEVETPSGVKSASSILKAVYVESPKWLPQSSSLSSGLHGEAVFLDLGDGKNVVVLLALGSNGEQYFGPDVAARALGQTSDKSGVRSGWYKEAPTWTGSADLTDDLMPTFVTFGDLLKPETARVISPSQLNTVIGKGYSLKRVWIEMTSDQVTRRIGNTITWLGNSEMLSGFWKGIYVTGFRPSGLTKAQTLLTR